MIYQLYNSTKEINNFLKKNYNISFKEIEENKSVNHYIVDLAFYSNYNTSVILSKSLLDYANSVFTNSDCLAYTIKKLKHYITYICCNLSEEEIEHIQDYNKVKCISFSLNKENLKFNKIFKRYKR